MVFMIIFVVRRNNILFIVCMVDAILPVCLFCSFFIKMLIKRSCVTKDPIKLNIIAFHDINIYIELTAQDGVFV